MVVVLCIDYRRLRDLAMVFYGGTVFLLVAVLAPVGSNIKGHQAWFQLPGGFTLQPSELAKFGIIVALAGYCNQYRGEIDAWRAHRDHRPRERPDRPGAAAARPRDRAGARGDRRGDPRGGGREREAARWCSGSSPSPASTRWSGLGLLKQYQIDRLTTFLDPESGTSQGTAYNQEQSNQAIANGRLTGEGLRAGIADPGRLRARAAHRLHLHRGGGGARLRRRGRACSRCSPS